MDPKTVIRLSLGGKMAEVSRELAPIGIQLEVPSEAECFGFAMREATLDALEKMQARVNQRGG